jgi:hypothetical protein
MGCKLTERYSKPAHDYHVGKEKKKVKHKYEKILSMPLSLGMTKQIPSC